MLKIVIRAPEEMVFSQDTIDAINKSGMVFTRAANFIQPKDYIVVNHGSRAPLNFGPKVKSAVVLNNPNNIHLSVSKKDMYEHVAKVEKVETPAWKFLPRGQNFMEAMDTIGIPAILKPNTGHKGKGAVVVSRPSEIMKIFKEPPTDYILQKYVDAHGEYRFNFLNGELLQVSKKLLPEEKEKYPGIFDGWRSLGQATELHKTAHKMAKKIAETFPLPSLAVDLLRYGDPDKPKWAFCEVNTGYGIGEMTATRLKESLEKQWKENRLTAYKVK